MSWFSVRLHPPVSERAAALKVLFELGSSGVQEEGDALLTCFPSDVSRERVERELRIGGVGAAAAFSELEEVDWSERWRDGVGVHQVGSLTVCPPWLAQGHSPQSTIVIDPAMAFGTGEHASTRCVLRLLQSYLSPGGSVADLGAGSGVLSIAAAKLGARYVAAIESDPDAVGNLAANIERNGAADSIVVLEGDAATLLPLVSPVDVVAANIVTSVLLELLPQIRGAVGLAGTALLGGILSAERVEFERALAERGWRVTSESNEDSWCALAIQTLR